jgi:hypothetical protein
MRDFYKALFAICCPELQHTLAAQLHLELYRDRFMIRDMLAGFKVAQQIISKQCNVPQATPGVTNSVINRFTEQSVLQKIDSIYKRGYRKLFW